MIFKTTSIIRLRIISIKLCLNYIYQIFLLPYIVDNPILNSMQEPIEKNDIFDLAVQFVNNTNRNLFLTGKAGSGKTTFLKYIKEHSHKKLAIVAPTGVAAINAGGVTIHSLFQLPFGNFLLEQYNTNLSSGNFYNKQNLLKNIRLSSAKRSLLQELDLLIIDEVSMVRADLLDAIDVVLKWVRKQPHVPFGGVQMLFIGDLFQLPPVINADEWNVLQLYYKSPFFFHAISLQDNLPLYIELKKIYRQNDADFIHLLNNIRNNEINAEDILFLNQYYRPDFKPAKEKYIVLTSHNIKANQINQKELKNLKGKLHTFSAEVKGEFNEKSVPVEKNLALKEGAQIMFIKNDKGDIKRYYNGKIGTIKKIWEDEIYVMFPDDDHELLLEKETWNNIRYNYNKETDLIEEEIIGTFVQFPIRLAWAITIHKSQGLTFEKAIIDAGESFAAGQVYVALSRLTSLDGLVLYSKINTGCINTDKQALAFTRTELQIPDLQQHLKIAQQQYLHNFVLQVFNWNLLVEAFENFENNLEQRQIPLQEEAKTLAKELLKKIKMLHKTALDFSNKLRQMFIQAEQDHYNHLLNRIEAAEKYFNDALHKEIFLTLQKHYDKVKKLPKVKKYKNELQDLMLLIKQKKFRLEQVVKIIKGLNQGIDSVSLLHESLAKKKEGRTLPHPLEKTKKAKASKGSTQKISLNLFKEGKNLSEIATERGFAISTIEGHLASFIESGEIDIKELVSSKKINNIQQVIEELEEGFTSSNVKEILGDDYSYGEIKAVMAYLKRIKEVSTSRMVD